MSTVALDLTRYSSKAYCTIDLMEKFTITLITAKFGMLIGSSLVVATSSCPDMISYIILPMTSYSICIYW